MIFYLGTHMPNHAETVNIPWFVSVARLVDRKSKLKCKDWIMDSGGFGMILAQGKYTISPEQYTKIIEYQQPRLAFCQDWMCEPFIMEKTGKTVQDHQGLTIKSYLQLRELSPLVRPVLQGWAPTDFASHVRQYADAGVDMSQLFGVGTVCSRNGSTMGIYTILKAIHDAQPGIKLHGFGLKTTAFHDWDVVNMLESADSMAWSSRGRRDKLCPWCSQKSCAHCMEYALVWRKKVLQGINKKFRQMRMM